MMSAYLRGILGTTVGYRNRVIDNLNLIYPEIVLAGKTEITDQMSDNAGHTFIKNMYPAEFQTPNGGIGLWAQA
jgi:KDO2-lipid IV(A) lauroyltransferase